MNAAGFDMVRQGPAPDESEQCSVLGKIENANALKHEGGPASPYTTLPPPWGWNLQQRG